MKKLFHTLLAVGLLFGLTSCGGGAGNNENYFTVTYETEHGTAPESISVKDGDILTADQLKAIKAEGFTFKGWFDGETEAKADEYVVTKDVTLTAKWEVATKYYTVTFETSIGTKPDALKVAENTILKAEQLPALKDSDGKNNFKGWFDGETEAKADEYVVTKDVTLTAKWEVAFTLLKSWDYTIVDIDTKSGKETKMPTRITFVDDKNFLGTVVFDMEAMTGVEMDPLFYTVKGTYTNTNGKIALTFDETQLSLVNGAAWLPVSEDPMGFMENIIDMLKSFEISVNDNKLQIKEGEDFIDYKEAALIDEKMIGAWEIDEDYEYRLQFESDNTLYTAEIDGQTKGYCKGKYVIMDGFLLGYFTEISSDFETWSKLEEDDINNSMMTIKYSFKGDKLYLGSDYSKMSTPNIKY